MFYPRDKYDDYLIRQVILARTSQINVTLIKSFF